MFNKHFLVFWGCIKTNEKGQEIYTARDNITLVLVFRGDFYDILVHEETKVVYIKYRNGNQAGLTVMLDQDGKPLLWEGEQ